MEKKMIDVEAVWCSIFVSVLDSVVVQTTLCPCFLVVISSTTNIQNSPHALFAFTLVDLT